MVFVQGKRAGSVFVQGKLGLCPRLKWYGYSLSLRHVEGIVAENRLTAALRVERASIVAVLAFDVSCSSRRWERSFEPASMTHFSDLPVHGSRRDIVSHDEMKGMQQSSITETKIYVQNRRQKVIHDLIRLGHVAEGQWRQRIVAVVKRHVRVQVRVPAIATSKDGGQGPPEDGIAVVEELADFLNEIVDLFIGTTASLRQTEFREDNLLAEQGIQGIDSLLDLGHSCVGVVVQVQVDVVANGVDLTSEVRVCLHEGYQPLVDIPSDGRGDEIGTPATVGNPQCIVHELCSGCGSHIGLSCDVWLVEAENDWRHLSTECGSDGIPVAALGGTPEGGQVGVLGRHLLDDTEFPVVVQRDL